MSQKSSEVDDPNDLEDFAEAFTCTACKKKFKHYRTLRQHVIKVHPNEQSELAPRLKYGKTCIYKCDQCTKQFNDIYNLRSHKRKVHGIEESLNSNENLRKCVMCDTKATKCVMLVHYKDVHDIEIDVKALHFETYDLFLVWKDKFEKESKTKFVNERGVKRTKESTKHSVVCHRSGHYTCRGKGKRHLKTQGSNKINGFCPARMDIVIHSSGKCSIKFTSTHIGHSNDIGHLFLSTSERHAIATKIASKVPFEAILDDVRDSISESGLERIHLLTKKDLFNIANNFNLHSSAVRHKVDGVSVEACENEAKINETDAISRMDGISVEACENEAKINETDAIVAELRKTHEVSAVPLSLAERKDRLKKKFLDTINELSIPEQVEVLEKMHATLGPTLAAVYSGSENSKAKVSDVHQSISIPHNKKIQLQRRLFSTKKTKRKRENIIAKPTEDESHKIALSLILLRDENIET